MSNAPDSLLIHWDSEDGGVLPQGFVVPWVDAALRGAFLPFHPVRAQVDLAIVGEERIREINREHRGIDDATDVLSFPMMSLRHPADAARLARRSLDPETGRVALGDIVICHERAGGQARAFGHSLTREMGFLAVHGLLHLLGYDHQMPDAARAMERVQEEALVSVGLDRAGLGERLVSRAVAVRRNAYAPYSRYAVGACLVTSDGLMIDGVNVENASYGVTLCAERCAVAAAVAQGARSFEMMAVAADTPPVPCGVCRQVLYEFAPGLRLIIAGERRIEAFALRELLPNAFGVEALGHR